MTSTEDIDGFLYNNLLHQKVSQIVLENEQKDKERQN